MPPTREAIGMRHYEDFQVGESVDLGQIAVTEEEIIAFARQFDPQPFHVDAQRARDSIFGGLVASGWHTAALYMRLLVGGLLKDSASLGSPGIDALRWLQPVRPGDTLRACFTVLECRLSQSRPGMGIVRGRGEVWNQDERTVMTVESIGFFGRRADPD
jgi:acyl dehydratase